MSELIEMNTLLSEETEVKNSVRSNTKPSKAEALLCSTVSVIGCLCPFEVHSNILSVVICTAIPIFIYCSYNKLYYFLITLCAIIVPKNMFFTFARISESLFTQSDSLPTNGRSGRTGIEWHLYAMQTLD